MYEKFRKCKTIMISKYYAHTENRKEKYDFARNSLRKLDESVETSHMGCASAIASEQAWAGALSFHFAGSAVLSTARLRQVSTAW